MCPSCSNLNFQWREQCNQCKEPKPEQAVEVGAGGEVADVGLQPTQAMRPGDWRCTCCSNIK